MFADQAQSFPPILFDFFPGAPYRDRTAWAAVPESLRTAVVADAQAALDRPWPVLSATGYRQFCLTGERAGYEEAYFERRRTLNHLALAELLEGRGRFLDRIVDAIFSICEESGWQLPAHNADERGRQRRPLPDVEQPIIDLFSAETGASLSVLATLLAQPLDAIDPLVVARVKHEVHQRILAPYLGRHFWWMGRGCDRMNNWTAWITQNVLLATFCLATDDDVRRQVAGKALCSLDAFIKDYAADGGCDEGVVYYRHAALCLHGAMTILDAVAPGAMMPLWAVEKIRNMAEFIVNMHVEGRQFFNFADSAAVIDACTVREYRFGQAVGSRSLAAFAARNRSLADQPHLPNEWSLWYRVQELLTGHHVERGVEVIPATDALYPGIGLFVARDNRFALAVKGGNNGESHNHNDVGSVTLYRDGKPLLIDVGVETYTARTFSPRRYDIWTMQSGFHNLPSFGGIMQSAGEQFGARDVDATFDAGRARVCLDLAAAYPAQAQVRSYRRTVTLQRGQFVEIVDEHDGDLPAVLSLMVCAEPSIEGCTIRLESLGRVELDGAGPVTIEEIAVDDARLRASWPAHIYRLQVPLAGPCLKLRII
ncbi:MAG: heparinase II/III family protein [Pseudorhizobium sp.]